MSRRRRALLHLTGAVLVPACLAAAAFELHRALAGHLVAWAYALQWPLIAGFGVHVWVRLVRDGSGPVPAAPEPDAGRVAQVPPVSADDELVAWQAYVAALHAADPPGGPERR